MLFDGKETFLACSLVKMMMVSVLLDKLGVASKNPKIIGIKKFHHCKNDCAKYIECAFDCYCLVNYS